MSAKMCQIECWNTRQTKCHGEDHQPMHGECDLFLRARPWFRSLEALDMDIDDIRHWFRNGRNGGGN